MGFFKYFHFGLKRKYKYLFVGFVIALIIWNFLTAFGFCSSDGEIIDYFTVSNLSVSSDNKSYVAGTSTYRVWNLSKGFVYTFYNDTTSTAYVRLTDVVPAPDVSVLRTYTIQPRSSITVELDDDSYFVSSTRLSMIRENGEINSMSYAIGGLITGIPSSDIWSTFKSALPFLLVCVLLAFGFYIIRSSINRLSKGGSGDTYKRKGYYNKKKGYYYNSSAFARAKARGKAKSS